MNITFLGTGPAGRIPRPNCGKWYVCQEAKKPGSKSARLQSSTFFEFSKVNILIDITQDFEKQVKLLNKKQIDFVFLTHGHSDAAFGLPFLASGEYKKRFNPIIYTEKQTFEVAKEEKLRIADLKFKSIEPFQECDFESFKLVPFRVEHAFNPRFLTLGYLFEIGKKRVVYASDFKKIPEKSKKLIKKADLAILDCAAYKRPIPTHVSFPEILELAKEMKFKKIYLTQVGIAWPHYELAQEIVAKQAKNIFLAYDGLSMRFV
ncbi:MAG: MBL fold metallo-hydrolase [Candidatus Azambacteria bacterium]|nr:MBL fold metallo-hydrolase [Candidatus Azambacteria bacterium]